MRIRSGFRLALILLFTVLQLLAGSAALSDADLRLPRVVVASGGPYRCGGVSIQKYNDAIEISQEYLNQPLSMVCTNGSESAPGFDWIRFFLLPDKTDQNIEQYSQPAGRLLIDEKSFLASSQIYLDLTRQLKAGQNKVFIEGGGPAGAVFAWEMRSIGTPHVFPLNSLVEAGNWLTVYGAGFSLRPGENAVDCGPMRLPVGESNGSSLAVFIPKNFPAGTYDLSVSIRTYRSRSIKLQVKAAVK